MYQYTFKLSAAKALYQQTRERTVPACRALATNLECWYFTRFCPFWETTQYISEGRGEGGGVLFTLVHSCNCWNRFTD